MENNYGYQEKQGSVLTGFIGALIGALIGGAIWMVVGILGYIASIIGFVIAFLASKGYDLMKGRQGTIKMVILIICVVLAVAAGTFGTYIWSAHDVYQEEIASLTELELKLYDIPSEADFIKDIMSDSEVQTGMLKDCGMGLLFGILGSYGLIAAAKNGKKNTAKVQDTIPYVSEEDNTADTGSAEGDN